MSLTKHKFEELELSNLPENYEHAIVHDVDSELSPVKQSAKNCKYFQAQLSDGKKPLKLLDLILPYTSLRNPPTHYSTYILYEPS